MDREHREKLNQPIYESLCRKACATPKRPAPNETVEDVYWWSICREVYRYLGVRFNFVPEETASRGDVYRNNLIRLISDRQTSLFDSMAIASKHIEDALDKICEVHQRMMKLTRVPLAYGLPPKDEELWAARERLFPNAKSYLLGGCIVGSSGHDIEALVCVDRQISEKCAHRGRIEFPWVTLSMKQDEALDPVSISFFGPQAKVFEASQIAHLIQQFSFSHGGQY
jgi:hypothetical protein